MCNEALMNRILLRLDRQDRMLARLAGQRMARRAGSYYGRSESREDWPGADPQDYPGAPGGPAMPPGACDGRPACPPQLVSPEAAAAIKAGPRVVRLSPAIGALAAGASAPAVVVASNGLRRVVTLADLVSTLTNLDNLRITVSVGGVERFSLNGGVFSRGNANTCTTSCGYSVCLWPIETMSIVFTNQTGSAFGVDTATLDIRSTYEGEPGFNEACGDCTTVAEQAGVA